MASTIENVKDSSFQIKSEFSSNARLNKNDESCNESKVTKVIVAKKNQIRPQCLGASDKLRCTENGFLSPKCKPIKWHIEKPIRTACSECGEQTENVFRPVSGQTTYLWAVFLLFTTGICCPLPFALDKCKDKQVLCIRCCSSKGTQRTECCQCI